MKYKSFKLKYKDYILNTGFNGLNVNTPASNSGNNPDGTNENSGNNSGGTLLNNGDINGNTSPKEGNNNSLPIITNP